MSKVCEFTILTNIHHHRNNQHAHVGTILTVLTGSHLHGRNQHDAPYEALPCRFYTCTFCTSPCLILPLQYCKMTYQLLSLCHGSISWSWLVIVIEVMNSLRQWVNGMKTCSNETDSWREFYSIAWGRMEFFSHFARRRRSECYSMILSIEFIECVNSFLCLPRRKQLFKNVWRARPNTTWNIGWKQILMSPLV